MATKSLKTRKRFVKTKKGVDPVAAKVEEKPVTKRYFSGKHLLILLFSGLFLLLVIFLYFLNKRLNVAKVNGQPISRIELYRELEKKSAKEVLDELITKKIIFQEAKKNNIVVSKEDIDGELAKINTSVSSQGATLNEVLEIQGVTYEQLVENIKIQKILEVILKDSINVTDEEIKNRYDENKDVYGKEKTFDELKEDIKFQLYQERITAAYRTWIEEKRSSSVIENYL